MSPILGIIASTKFVTQSSYESIATINVGSGGTADVTFNSIPSTYTHLQIRGIVKTAFSNNQDGLKIQYNGDTSAIYNYHYLGGNGSVTYSGGNPSATNFMQSVSIAGNNNTNVFGALVLDVLDYANLNKYKVQRALGGTDSNGAGVVEMWSGLYLATTAITSIKLFSFNGSNLNQYTQFALYGIKG
jgi:hypothetical protein